MDNANSNNKIINEEIIDNLVLQVNALEKREVKLPDYNERFSVIESLIIRLLPDQEELTEILKAEINRHNLAYPAQQIQSQIDQLRNELALIPKVIPVKNHHHLDVKTRPIIIAGTLLLVFVALSAGLNIYLWTANSRLEANDIKFRMTRQMYPKEAKEADTAYARDPSAMEKLTVKYETEALERSKAADIAEQKEREAKDAKDKLKKLKKHRL
ncbi:hypothetical protein [uncultured Mucilaginibacter sp.]|uniref:hypothetical protein n=1 Tax=uncultured Mucilaginibacter sp. TaxID=797541 RepID=UPI00261CE44B|nr:hypothetical protein [uncultured Mucilaginibacter sp.]